MKFKYGESLLLALLLLFLELIKRCCPKKTIIMVDPLKIKINTEKFENISIILLLNETIDNRAGKQIKLQQLRNLSNIKAIYSTEENQDKNNKQKIEFKINLKYFEGQYGKYMLSYIDEDPKHPIYYNNTIFIYVNDIILKNPKKKYFLTGNGNDTAKYDFSLQIAKDEINKILYYEVSTPNNKTKLESYSLEEDNKKLSFSFPKTNKSSTYKFEIYPEYDKNISNPDIQHFYLYFQDYLINNDAIYINKNDNKNEVSFNLTLRKNFNLNNLFINQFSYSSKLLNNLVNDNYEIFISLGSQSSPGKITMSYSGQERDLFYILYEENFKDCYEKTQYENLEIEMEWINEMEYDHFLYFNDTTTKVLSQSFRGKSASTTSYKYTYSTLSLNSGVFSLKSTIPSLNYSLSYNPVDIKHLYFLILPSSQTFERNGEMIVYSHDNSDQIIYINSSEPDGITVLDEIELRRNDNKTNFLVSRTKTNPICKINNTHFYCDLKSIILNYDDDKNGNYSIIYKSQCDTNLIIDGNFVIIRRGIGLSNIYPTWINTTNISKTELILTYDDNKLKDRNLTICFNKKDEDLKKCRYPRYIDNNKINGEKVTVSLDNMVEGIYVVRTMINDGIDFVDKDKKFKISNPKIQFHFNHHYFVKNNNEENKLIITVEDPDKEFGCRIFENIDNKNLTDLSNNCTIFEYKIDKTGTIKFSFYDNDSFIIPINDFITVVSDYSQLFLFNEKLCYYYKFDISIDILKSYENDLNIKVFLKDTNNNIYSLNNSESNKNKYTLQNINSSFLDIQGFDLYISEGFEDDKIYLYKSSGKVKFTNISTPEFIIDPNKTIVFSDVNCDLSSSTFIIKKLDTSYIQNYLTNCKFTNSYLYCNILGDFYLANRFQYYYYQIDYNNISDINNKSELYKTFVSKRLNKTNFELKKADSNDYVTITNEKKDFYFPLLKSLTAFQESKVPKNKTYKREDEELDIDDKNYTIKFDYELAINDVLKIIYLERDVKEWENRQSLGNSIYYFFNKDNIINGSSLAISPKLFAFNIPEKEYNITILYSEEKQKNYKKENITNCINNPNNNLKQECSIAHSKYTKDGAAYILINITDNIVNYYENIDFVYYYLDDNSKKCQTKDSNMNNITLLVDIPNANLKDKIKLNSPDTDITDGIRAGNRISFILNGKNINLQSTYLQLYTDDLELDHWFILQDLGINILPKYKMRFNNNKNVTYLLPEDNQIVKVFISVENNEIINLTDISEFKIKGENSNKDYNIEINSKSTEENTLNLIFNLSSVNKSEKNYLLYYYDKCPNKNEIKLDLKISLITFDFKRKYFVLNNNKNLIHQTLIIEGPENDKISLSVYKDGEYKGQTEKLNKTHYSFNFSQSSQGDYTFKVINERIESFINETVYVRQNLEEILTLKESISDCMFSNSDKSAIKDFSYTITPSNNNINLKGFQSYFTHNQKDFTILTPSGEGKEKSFIINYSESMKRSINLNNKLYIYLTESNDIEQPIYIFNYTYTTIQLHSTFSKFIYTDAEYILFNMNCKINKMKNFILNNANSGNDYSITCENRDNNDLFYEDNKLYYRCYLSSENSGSNNLLTIGEYGNYNIKYDQIQITNEPFFLSHDIYTADFNIIPPSEIGRNVSINIIMKTQNKIFYFSQVEKVTYYIDTEIEKDKEIEFKYNSDNYISFSLYIISGKNYTIKKICRKECSYCRKNEEYIKEVDCQLLKGEPIRSNTPEIYFTFDKHYIALVNSSSRNGDKDKNSLLTIKLSGESHNELQQIIVYHYITSTNVDGPKYINRQNDESFSLSLSEGKYTFQYRYNNKYYNIRDIVLVTTYDYEMFDFSDFSNKCVFYDLDDGISGLLVSINANPNYEFKNDIILAYLILELNGYELTYNGEKGYKISDKSMFNNKNYYFGKIYFRESNLPDKDFIFTTLYNISTNTIDKNSLYQFYYKDNIIFKQQNCESNNIYIKSSSNPGESFSLLQCNYSENNQTCDAIYYKFSYKTNDYFYLYIGNKRLNTSFAINIYNSIKDSTFTLNYIKPTIYIESSNFDMEKIYQFNIDNNKNITYPSFNKLPDSNSIEYIYEIDNITESYVTELIRNIHDLDRVTTIRNKKVYLKIERKKCPNYMVEVLGESGSLCVSCALKISAFGENGQNIWYQNGECVSACYGEYSIYDQVNHYCMICPEKTYIDGQTICGCLEGTVKNPMDGVCYLPEDPEIKKALIIRPNVQCYRIDGITHNYCKNDTTSKCELISYSGADFPICHCIDGFTGKYCEIKQNEIILDNNIDAILNMTIDDKINENDPVVISKIRGVFYFIEKDNSYTNTININKINSFLDISINCIKTAVDEEHKYFQIYDVIEATVHFLLFKINNSRRLRLLEEDKKEVINNLNYILENTHFLNYLANNEYSGSNYNIQSDGLNLISFISYKTNSIDDGFKTYIKNMTANSSIIGYTNLNGNNIGDDKENVMAVLTIFNRKLLNLDSSEDGLIFNFSLSNNNVELSNLKDFYAYIYSPFLKVDFELANYYQAKNINIYDKYDSCFTDDCFTSEHFEYDLTQKYRKKYVFQKWSLNSDICKYHSFENASNNIEILCQKFEDFGKMDISINYATLSLSAKKDYVDNQDKVYNLPLKCRKKLNSENYAFWIFLIICILEIMYIIGITILTLGSLRKVSIKKGLRNDGFFYIIPRIYNTNDDMVSNLNNPLKKEKKDDYKNSIEESLNSRKMLTFNKSLLETIYLNFKELHPLSVFCRASIISPLIMNSWFFVFNTLCLLGFNALIYYEGLIEKRIYDKKRNYFDYPMRKEFHKIILSILLQMAFTVIIKATILVTLKQYNDLESKFRSCKMKGEEINNDIILRHDDFQDEMQLRRLIGGALMTIIIVFFFYYSVVFCEVYLNTQRNLVFSWVWSLFWIWVIFAPIYIVVISVLEKKKANSKDPLVYYLKRLFFF